LRKRNIFIIFLSVMVLVAGAFVLIKAAAPEKQKAVLTSSQKKHEQKPQKQNKAKKDKETKIELTYGEKNKYTAEDQELYAIPEGEYEVTLFETSQDKTGKMLVEKDENTYQKVTQYVFSEGESQTVVVNEGEQVSVSQGTSWEFDK